MSQAIMMMGISARRVPMDFDWPQNKTWKGYVGPTSRRCPATDCENGQISARRAAERVVSLLMLLAEDSDRGRLHPWLEDSLDVVPGPEIKELTSGLAGREPRMFGHDSSDNWQALKKIIAAAGLPEDWGICPVCHGRGSHPDDQARADEWESYDPPDGDGYQLWETISEGSPVSPVFATPSELARWTEANPPGNYSTLTYSDWLGVITGRVMGTDLASGKPVT